MPPPFNAAFEVAARISASLSRVLRHLPYLIGDRQLANPFARRRRDRPENVLVSNRARRIQKFAYRSAQPLHLRDVPGRNVRIADKEEVRFEGEAEQLLDGFAILRSPEAVPDTQKNLIEPRTRFPENVLEVLSRHRTRW